MSCFDPNKSELSMIPIETLRQWHSETVTALHKLSTGQQTLSLSYTQGDGTKTVTYSQANIADLRAWLSKLNAQLGVGTRSPIKVAF